MSTLRVRFYFIFPVHGGWSDWSVWTQQGSWVIKADHATRPETRRRDCNNPTPAHGGSTCQGLTTEKRNSTCAADQCTGIWFNTDSLKYHFADWMLVFSDGDQIDWIY